MKIKNLLKQKKNLFLIFKGIKKDIINITKIIKINLLIL